jgi:hypothetical protein
MFLKTVPAFAKGVRTPATIATRLPFPNLGIVQVMSEKTNAHLPGDAGALSGVALMDLHWNRCSLKTVNT